MTIKEQYEDFLQWLRAKHKEIIANYWNESDEARRLYRKLLLKIQAAAWETERKLRNLHV